MGAVGNPPQPPPDSTWSAQRIAATLPAPLRAQFEQEHMRFLALWQTKAQGAASPHATGEAAPTPTGARHKWGDLMDDWEL
jgi:hypothetical protein